MAFSTITRKRCKCKPDCDKWPTLSCYGYYYSHLPDDLKEKAGTKRAVQIKNRNKKNALSKKLHIAQAKVNNEDFVKSDLWFRSKRYQMTGVCSCGCGSKTSKDDDKYYKFSACHVLMKAKFKSIAWHPDNWVELSFWNGCHTTFDNMGYEYCKEKKPILWSIVVEKFKILYPLIAPNELGHIPDVLLETLIVNPSRISQC